MKYAYMSFSTPDLDLAGMLEVARRYGYDGLEPRLDANHAHGLEVGLSAEQCAKIKTQVAASGVALACLATSLSYADPKKTGDMIAQTHARIDLAGDLNVKALRVFGGQIPPGMSRTQAIDLLVTSLGAVVGHAEERGVTLCLETHDDWCDPAQVATVLGRVNRAGLAANWDVMHPVRTGLATIEASFERLKPWIRHLHIHDGVGENVKMVPIGEGLIDHRRVVELLSSLPYDGFLSGEWINWEAYEVHLPRELATMKRYERETQKGQGQVVSC